MLIQFQDLSPDDRVRGHDEIGVGARRRIRPEELRLGAHLYVLVVTNAQPIDGTRMLAGVHGVAEMLQKLVQVLRRADVLQRAANQILIEELRVLHRNARHVNADDLPARVQFGSKLLDQRGVEHFVAVGDATGDAQQTWPRLRGVIITMPQLCAGDVHTLVLTHPLLLFLYRLVQFVGFDQKTQTERTRLTAAAGSTARLRVAGKGYRHRQQRAKTRVVTVVNEIIDTLAVDFIACELDVGDHVVGDVLHLALGVHNKQKSLERLQQQRAIDLIRDDRRLRGGHFALLHRVGGQRGVLALLYATYLVDGLLKNGAFVRLYRYRAHVRKVGRYQLR